MPRLGELYLVSGDQAAELERHEALAHYLVAGAFPMERDILLERLHYSCRARVPAVPGFVSYSALSCQAGIMCRCGRRHVSKWRYLPAGGGSDTIDKSKQRITSPARMLATSHRRIPRLPLHA